MPDQAIVIGAGPGLGRSLALEFAGHGLAVGLIARRPEPLEELAAEVRRLGVGATAIAADAADPESVVAAVTELSGESPVHILAYNAFRSGGRLLDAGLDHLRSAADVNIFTPVRVVQALLDPLRATSGSVLLTGGGLAHQPVGDYGVLSVGKAAIRAAALALSQDLEPDGVRVRTITVAGVIKPGTPFDPGRIAASFWAAHTDHSARVEWLYDGSG